MSNRRTERKRFTLYSGELKALAGQLGRSVSTVSRLISGERPSRSLAERFHALTGYWPHEVAVTTSKRPDKAAA